MNRLLKVNSRRFGMFTAATLMVSGLTAPSALAGRVTPRVTGPANTWIPASPMSTARAGATATLLSDGKVLIAGGGTDSAELYNPATSGFTPTGKMPVTVADATATLLPDGQVLVAGGEHGAQVASAELYDPSTGTWTPTGSMNKKRSGQTATLLPNGDVLVAGGGCQGSGLACDPTGILNNLASAELYDPSTGTWTMTGKMHVGRQFATASLLPDGQVLEGGGFASCNDACFDTSTAELYDPATGNWTMTGKMHFPREQQTATLLQNGQVLVAGGLTQGGGNGLAQSYASAELYDPATGKWTGTASMSTAHAGGTATLLSNGWVLVAGGQTPVAEIYEPQLAKWVLPGAMSTVRTHLTATLLPDGHVLVTGGAVRGAAQATAEVFLAGPGPLVSISPGTIAFGGQQVGSTSTQNTFTVTNLGSGNLVANGVNVSGLDPGDFRATTDCAKAPVAAGGTCTLTVKFAPVATALRTAVLGLSDNAPRSPQPVAVNGYGGGPDTWVPVGPMPFHTADASSARLPNGDVLIAGGYYGTSIANAELYHPATRTFTATGSLNAARSYSTAVTLPTGEVLMAGGDDTNFAAMSSAELYNPATGRWSYAKSMNEAGSDLTSTLLPNGKVLVTGFGLHNLGEVYDPAANTWTNTGVMPSRQVFDVAVLLKDGDVLVTGGSTQSAELYDPNTNAWTATGSMSVARRTPLAVLLPNGNVEVAGGIPPGGNGPTMASADVYDPAKGTWTQGAPMTVPRYGGTGVLLTNGEVLAAGGCNICGDVSALSSTELFTGAWNVNAAMTQPRVFQTGTLLADGNVLVAGGQACYFCGGSSTAELYTPLLFSLSPTSGPVGTQVTATGSGFYAHETVRLQWDRTRLVSAKTAADGTFSVKFTVPQSTAGTHSVSVVGLRSTVGTSAGFNVTG